MLHTNLGNFVRQKRKEKGLSQAELAKSLGYKNGQFVSNMERGLNSLPYENLPLLASSLDTTVLALKTVILQDCSVEIDNKTK